MGTGALVQPLAQRIERTRSGRALPVGMGFAALGMLVAAGAFSARLAVLMLPAAIALGAAYGIVLVAGLRRMEEIGHPQDRARLNAVFYSFTYIGFAQPLVFALLAATQSAQVLYAVLGAVVAVATMIYAAVRLGDPGV